MHRSLAVACLLLLPALTACSGSSGMLPGGPTPLFRTHIFDEGSKRFTFEAAPLDTLPTQWQGEQEDRPRQQTQRLLEQRDALHDAQLTQALAAHKYCREGYIVLSQTPWKIRGECNETATQVDRDTFPNQASWHE